MERFAHLTKVRNGYELLINTSNRPVETENHIWFGKKSPVTKKEAKRLASDWSAVEWNF